MEFGGYVWKICDACGRGPGNGKFLVCNAAGCETAVHARCVSPSFFTVLNQMCGFFCVKCALTALQIAEERAQKPKRKAVLCGHIENLRAFGYKDVVSQSSREVVGGVSVRGDGLSESSSKVVGAVRVRGDGSRLGGGNRLPIVDVIKIEDDETGEVRNVDVINLEDDESGGDRNVDVINHPEDVEGEERDTEQWKCIQVHSNGGANGGADAFVPESGDFEIRSPLLCNKRFKQCEQKVVLVPLRMEPSPSLSRPTDALKENAEKQKGKGIASCSEEEIEPITFSGTRKLPDWNRKEGDVYFKPRKVPHSNQHEKVTTSSPKPSKSPASTSGNLSDLIRVSEVNEGKSWEQEQMQTGGEVPAEAILPKTPESATENLVHPCRRRRVNWTAEELEFLKEKAPTFLVNKNIAWKKVLEAGKNVFHPTRTPDSLKDKYKSIEDKNNGCGNLRCRAEGEGVDGGRIQDESMRAEEELMDMNTEQRTCIQGMDIEEIVPSPSGKSSSHLAGALKENGDKPNEKAAVSYSESRVPESSHCKENAAKIFLPEWDQNKAVSTSSAETSKSPDSASEKLSAPMIVSEENKGRCREEEHMQTEAEVPADAILPESGQIPESASEYLEVYISRPRRVKWTAEELDFLKNKVLYTYGAERSVPWRKILEEGKDVFKNRTAENLKDKWKNLCKSREELKNNKT